MIYLPIVVLIVCLLLGLIFGFVPLPSPWKEVLIVVVLVIFLLWVAIGADAA